MMVSTRVCFKRAQTFEVLFTNGIEKIYERVLTFVNNNEELCLEIGTEVAGSHKFVHLRKECLCSYSFVDSCAYKPE